MKHQDSHSRAHFTLDGHPLCECQMPAYYDRLRAAGSPPCSDNAAEQMERAGRLDEQFPGRIALVFAGCPVLNEGAQP